MCFSKDGFFSTLTELGMPWGISFRTLPDDTLEGPVVLCVTSVCVPVGERLKTEYLMQYCHHYACSPGFLDSVASPGIRTLWRNGSSSFTGPGCMHNMIYSVCTEASVHAGGNGHNNKPPGTARGLGQTVLVNLRYSSRDLIRFFQTPQIPYKLVLSPRPQGKRPFDLKILRLVVWAIRANHPTPAITNNNGWRRGDA